MTQLIEFKNHRQEILRGLIDKANSKIGIILIHGFERTTIEGKFKNIVDKLRGWVNLFRFDFSGHGLSDGRFDDITVKKLSKELEKAVLIFKRHCPRVKTIILVSHSFGCCVVLKFMAGKKKSIINKVVFLAPAFNQKELLKFWFVVSKMKRKKIKWHNYGRYFSKKDFDKETKKPRIMTKSHFISSNYVLENENTDYQILLNDLMIDSQSILIVHGDSDDRVPFESNDNLPKDIEMIKVKKGDHDLEKVDSVVQYLDEVNQFIIPCQDHGFSRRS